jgi:GT2 family glycosyltransferase
MRASQRSTPSKNVDTIGVRQYLRQKRSHLKYLTGKTRFRLKKWRANLNRPSYYFRLVHDLLCRWHRMELGLLHQYKPRHVGAETFPLLRKQQVALPPIAIVTPSLNQGGTIAHTVESVLRQGYPRLAFAVVDGGSSDDTPEILERYKANLSYYVSEPDKGQSDAIAKGFVHVDGEIMGYLNADDLLMAGALQFVGEYFLTHERVDVIYSHRIIIDEHGQELGRWILPPHDQEAIRNFDYVPQETLFWRKSLYEAVGGIDSSFQFAMDWDLLLRFIRAGARFSRVPYFLACFRVHAKQKTQMLSEVVGEREKAWLIAREHPAGRNLDRMQRLQDSYRLRSSLCATLLKCGIRY